MEVKTIPNTHRVLIIEDIPILCDYYKSMLGKMEDARQRFSVETINTFHEASASLEKALKQNNVFDLALLDIRLWDKENRKTYDGEELGKRIRHQMPTAKIMVITSHDNNFRYHTIFENVYPDGFMLKYEVSDKEFTKAIRLLLTNKNYYGSSATKYLNAQINNKARLDNLDRKLLHLLSNCLTTKEISKILPLSESGVEKRKRNLSRFFDLEDARTVNIIKAAKENGYLD